MVQGSQLHPAFDQLFFVPVGQDDDRDRGGRHVSAQGFEDSEAIEFRQPDVQKDDVGMQRPCFFQRDKTVPGDIYGIPVQLELEPVHLRD